MNGLISFLESQDVKYQKDVELSKLTSIGIGGRAKILVSPKSKELFTKTLNYLFENAIPYKVIGNMTNILPCDRELETVLVSTLELKEYTISNKTVYADCGMLFSKLILIAANNMLGGCENIFGIPGTVGAMLSLNAGAYEASASDFLSYVDVYTAYDDCILRLKKEDISFNYRDSELRRQGFIVLGAGFNFLPTSKQDAQLKIKAVRNKRAAAQPINSKTLGSVFKRTKELSASYMIDRCGLKGTRIGNVSVSDKHAGFFINHGGGTADEFLLLADFVKSTVREKYGVILEEEFEYLT